MIPRGKVQEALPLSDTRNKTRIVALFRNGVDYVAAMDDCEVYLQRIVDKHPDYRQRRTAAAVLQEFGIEEDADG